MDRTRQGLLIGLGAYASWGLLSPVGKHLLVDFKPMGLNAVRFTVATVLFLLIVGPGQLRPSLALLRDRRVLWVNLLANGSLTLFLYSLTRLPANFATLGFYTAPLWTALLARPLLGERLGKAFLPAVVGLLVGGYITLFGWVSPSRLLHDPGLAGTVDPWGMVLTVASAAVWGFYTVALRKSAPDLPLKPLMGASFIFGAVYYYVIALVVEGPPNILHQAPQTWGWILLHVLFPSLLAFVCFNAALQRAPASLVNILVGAELAFTVLFSWLLFGIALAPDQLGGLAVVLVSVTAYLWMHSRSTAAPTPSPKSAP